jgi:hypothetical protein
MIRCVYEIAGHQVKIENGTAFPSRVRDIPFHPGTKFTANDLEGKYIAPQLVEARIRYFKRRTEFICNVGTCYPDKFGKATEAVDNRCV